MALPLLDVGLEVLHLLADGFAASLEFFHRVVTERARSVAPLGDLIVELDDLGMLRTKILGEGVAFRLEELRPVASLLDNLLPVRHRKTAFPCLRLRVGCGIPVSLWPARSRFWSRSSRFSRSYSVFERGVIVVESHEIGRGAVSLLLNETNVVLLLKFEHFVLAVAQILFGLDQLLGDAGRDVLTLVLRACLF